MQTSNFWNYTGPGRIVISRGIPANISGEYVVYRPLNPGPWFKSPECKDEATYRARYFSDVLGKLDPVREYEHLHALAKGAEPILLCWERDPTQPGEFCHRRMVAEWFEQALGVKVPEYPVPKKLKPASNQFSLFGE